MNHYQTLGVTKHASKQEIKDAYRRLVRLHHPDANPDDNGVSEAVMKQVLTAYATLSDPHKRTRYDVAVALDASDTPNANEDRASVTHHAPTYEGGPHSLMGKVRIALGDSPGAFAAKLGLSEMALAGYEARDAMPHTSIQLRTFTHLVEMAAKNLELAGKSGDANALRASFNRKKANRDMFR